MIAIKSQWVIYDEDDIPQLHTVTRIEPETVITEFNGQEFQWVPTVLEWIGEIIMQCPPVDQ